MTDLSRRGNRLVGASTLPPYLLAHFDRIIDGSGPHPYVCLAVAENKLMWDLLSEKVNAIRDVPPESMNYGAKAGSEYLRETVSTFASAAVWGTHMPADRLVVMSGAGTVIEAVSAVTGDEGRGILIPTPTYAAYWMDIETRFGLHAVPAPMSASDGFRISVDVLDETFRTSDFPITTLLLTNPSNPLGKVLDTEEIADAIAWGRSRGLHVVVNELYALTNYGDDPFVSAATMAEPGDDLHYVWGFSKDFGVSGLRAGVLASHNDDLLAAVTQHAIFGGVSGDTQFLLASMLDDAAWTERYLDAMRGRLLAARKRAEGALGAHGVDVISGRAALFLLADLRHLLDEPTWEAEQRVWDDVLERANVNLTPGSACRVSEPGFFRVCFATETADTVGDALDRSIAAVAGESFGAG